MAEAAEKAKVMALRKVETGREGDAQMLPRPRQASTRQSRRNRRQLVRWGLLAAGPLVVAVVIGWFLVTRGGLRSTAQPDGPGGNGELGPHRAGGGAKKPVPGQHTV